MKIIVLTFTIVLLNSYLLLSQQRADVKTPKGSNVIAYIPDEMSSGNRAYWDSYFESAYPNAEQINTYGSYSSSNKFNCHGYAWHMVESGSNLNDPRWIGYYYTTREDIYMSDGSYVQVANEMYPGKVSWSSGDHSAITTSQSGVFKSKWNKYPLFEHDWNDTPYGTNNLKYYVSTNINGSSSVLCNYSTRTFTTSNIPGASYSWSVGSGLTLNNNGNYSTTVTASSSYKGNTWIKVTITSPLGGSNNDIKTSKNKTFWVGKPSDFTITGSQELITGESGIAILHYSDNLWKTGVSNVTWSYTGPLSYINGDIYKARCNAGYSSGLGFIYALATNTCGQRENRMSFEVTGGGYNIYPNPAKDILTVEIEHDKMSKEMQTKEVEIRLYDKLMIMRKHKVFKGNLIRLNLNDLKPDVYILQLKIGDEIFEEKIMHSY